MKYTKSLIALFLIQFFLTSCQTKEDVHNYVVTPEFSKSIGKPEIHFKVNYPKSLKLDKPTKNSKSYGMLQERTEDGLVTEMCSFGYVKLDGITIAKGGKNFLGQITSMLEGAGYDIEESKIGFIKFDSEEYMSLNMIGTMKEGISDMFIGRYYFNSIIKPNPNSNTHIIFLMAAREDQGISNYSDFADKLSISTIWQTFKYL